jgi:hypothetical protein
MNIAWINLLLGHSMRCHQLAWFVYGCVEREHWVTLNSCGWWARPPRKIYK